MEVNVRGQAVKHSIAALSYRDVRMRAQWASASLNANSPVSLPDTKCASWCAITVLNEAFQCFLHILFYFSHASCLILFIAVVGHIELCHVLCLLTCCAVIPVKHSNNSLYVRRLRAKKPLRRFLKRICNITDVFVVRPLQMISSAC